MKLNDAINDHDIEAFVANFADDYLSEQPVHPSRTFRGRDQVRKNWTMNFTDMPDFSSRILHHETDENHIWVEWEWKGTRKNHSKLHMCGVVVFGVEDSLIQWARLYMEPVITAGSSAERSIREVMQGQKN